MENKIEYLEEGQNSPTNPALWSRAKAYSLSKAERAATAKKKKTKSKGGRKQFVANTKKAKVST